MPKDPIDPRLAQLRLIPAPQRVGLFLAAVTAMASDMGEELTTKTCQVRESDTPTGAMRSTIMHLMRKGAAAMDGGKPIVQATALWIDNALHNAVPGIAQVDDLELILNMEEFLVHMFGTDAQLGQAHAPTKDPSFN